MDTFTIDETDSTNTNLKYGDSDLSSKRRKSIFTETSPLKNLSKEQVENNYFKNFDVESIINSTFIEDDSMLNILNVNNDFKGGLLSLNTEILNSPIGANNVIHTKTSSDLNKFNQNIIQSVDKNSFVSKCPSGTSSHFDNTFSVLENQIRSKHIKLPKNCNKIDRSFLRRISEEYIPNLSSFSLECDNDSNTSSENNLSTINSKTYAMFLNKLFAALQEAEPSNINKINDNEEDNDENEPLTFFELELEAMQRVKELLNKHNPEILDRLNQQNEAGIGTSIITPITELLYGLKSIGLTNNLDDSILSYETIKLNNTNCDCSCNETVLETNSDNSEYLYHIAKGKDGKKYLKVVGSLQLDKVLCGNRVSQMTRAYDDIEAVTRLLEEKEKDLELTVQIGKELLQQNNRLESRINDLELDLKSSNEDRQQLIHDLHQKNELISVLTNDVDDGSENDTPTLSKSITLDLLQRKISTLQDENKSLKMEVSQVVKQTDEVERQERKLMEDITSQLNSTNSEFDGLSLELERQKEENRFQHEQIVSLTNRLSETEIRLHQLSTENDEQTSLLSITKENQNLLAIELSEFKQRYAEVLALLQEAQEQLRNFRKKQTPQVRSGSFVPGIGMPQVDSLHSELMESSIYSENSLDSGICTDQMNSSRFIGTGGSIHIPSFQKVFQTVQFASKNGQFSDGMTNLGAMSMSTSSTGPRMSTIPYAGPAGSYHRPSSVYSNLTYPSYDSMGAKTISLESLASQPSDDGSNSCYPSQQPSGVPGAPGAKDLEAALKRLTPSEVLARRAMLQHAPAGTYNYDESRSANHYLVGIRTPDSIMSTGSRLSSGSDRPQWRLPEKLQIVKPMEGSQTLGHWSRLATPNLSGLLEERPGVTIRGGRGLDELGLQLYSLCDVEEDVEDLPGKQYQESACVYTYTMSQVMHPDDGISNDLSFLSQSQLSSRMASNSTSRQSSCPQTPRGGLSRRNSCSTFSVNMGLASMLNERGIKAVTPSVLNTPAGPNFTPTVTPCNSPEGSPTRSMSPEPLFSGIFSQGADLIRRKLIGDYSPQHLPQPQSKQQKLMLSRLEKRALRSLRLLEKVESVGLENIIATTQGSGIGQIASRGIASRSSSPMSQLHSLSSMQASANGMVEDIHFHRSQIRSVLSKGLSNESLRSLTDSDLASSISDSDCVSDLNERFNKNNISNMKTSSPNKKIDDFKTELSTSSAVIDTNNFKTNGTITSDIRLKQMQRQKSRRNLKNGQRPDLGTVNGSNGTRVRPDLGKVSTTSASNNNRSLQQLVAEQRRVEEKVEASATQSMAQSFVGSISSLFFGRKGGWL